MTLVTGSFSCKRAGGDKMTYLFFFLKKKIKTEGNKQTKKSKLLNVLISNKSTGPIRMFIYFLSV